MNTPNQPHEHEHHDHNQVEGAGIKARPILMFLIILAVATAFVFVVVKGLEYAFDRMLRTEQGMAATEVRMPESQRKLPVEPRLQGAPGQGSTRDTNVPSALPLDDMREYRTKMSEQANDYGWMRKEEGVARVPIEMAKEMMVKQGLPQLPPDKVDEMSKAETARKEVLNADASAGRMLKKPQPEATITPPPAGGQPSAPAIGSGVPQPSSGKQQKSAGGSNP